MKYIKKLLSEQTRTTGQGERTRGATAHATQPNSTRTKKSIEKKVAAAGEIGPKPGQLPGSKNSKREDSHTVYHQMGMLMAEALGLVSEMRGRPRNNFMAARDTSTIQDKAKKTGESPADLRAAGGSSTLASIAREGRERRAKAAAEKPKKPTEDK